MLITFSFKSVQFYCKRNTTVAAQPYGQYDAVGDGQDSAPSVRQ